MLVYNQHSQQAFPLWTLPLDIDVKPHLSLECKHSMQTFWVRLQCGFTLSMVVVGCGLSQRWYIWLRIFQTVFWYSSLFWCWRGMTSARIKKVCMSVCVSSHILLPLPLFFSPLFYSSHLFSPPPLSFFFSPSSPLSSIFPLSSILSFPLERLVSHTLPALPPAVGRSSSGTLHLSPGRGGGVGSAHLMNPPTPPWEKREEWKGEAKRNDPCCFQKHWSSLAHQGSSSLPPSLFPYIPRVEMAHAVSEHIFRLMQILMLFIKTRQSNRGNCMLPHKARFRKQLELVSNKFSYTWRQAEWRGLNDVQAWVCWQTKGWEQFHQHSSQFHQLLSHWVHSCWIDLNSIVWLTGVSSHQGAVKG